jgi:uncharacterized protein
MRTLAMALVLLLLAGCGGSSDAGADAETSGDESTSAKTTATSNLQTVTIDSNEGEVEVRVEIADSPAEQARGLMDRTALAEDRGMLFVFPEEEVRSFWMRNTLIPLSVAYIDAEGRIVDIDEMQPLDETQHPSDEPARYALEVNQGFFEERGVQVGDTVEWPPEAR